MVQTVKSAWFRLLRQRCSDGQFIVCARTDAAGVWAPQGISGNFSCQVQLLVNSK